MDNLFDVNIEFSTPLIKPIELINTYSSLKVKDSVAEHRKIIEDILTKKDNRLLCIAGPCSIHNDIEAYEYAKVLKTFQEKFKDKLFIVMRTYFEKPRTTIGWKGFINDPNLDNSFDVNKGIKLSRKLLFDINKLGLPCATEILDSITPQYLSDLLSWGCIGSRTVESQIHRQIASGCSFPIGFKNGKNGDITSAINAIVSANHSHCFRGISLEGIPSICKTVGNSYGHIVLRGSYDTGPNYSRYHIGKTKEELYSNMIYTGIVIDCSHGNSLKKHENQKYVVQDIISQIINGEKNIKGIMLESNINSGKQKISSNLKRGVSITDACINLQETDILFKELYSNL